MTIKSNKILLTDNLSRELLEVAIGLKSKCKEKISKFIKMIVKNVLPEYKKWLLNSFQKKKKSCCLKCDTKANNEKIIKIMLDKIVIQKSRWAICDSRKSTF